MDGDVVLYSGSHPMHRLQFERTGCPWAQVGLILGVCGETCIFESTRISTCTDVEMGVILQGVQWVRLSERIGTFEGAIAARRLEPPLPGAMIEELAAFAREVHGRPFNDSRWIALRSIRRRNPPPSGSCFFCSELVAEAYQRIGLLPTPPGGRSSNNYIPADFSTMYSDRMLPLRRDFRLGDEVVLKPPPMPTPLLAPSARDARPPR
jgi:hypothetical protein